MKYITEFRDRILVDKIISGIHSISSKPLKFMEVCSGHTMAIQKYGIPALLPENIELISGPGCPVCVTSRQYIDHAIALSKIKDIIITTYGDLMRVPGSMSSLDKEKGAGADIRMVYSTLEALKIAINNTGQKVIFLAIGFEATMPSTASAVIEASKLQIDNFFILSSHKIMPPAMEAIIDEGVKISGYIAPGHVSAITGTAMYGTVVKKFNIPVVISGFEPVDILQSIYFLIKQNNENNTRIEIQYKRVVKEEGNLKAQKVINEIFEPRDEWWRGLGILKNSGMGICQRYDKFDAEKRFSVNIEPTIEPKGCICGEILKGLKKPFQCGLFANKCTPEFPVGACMVSTEGARQAYYKYSKHE